jgi:hypothetical protein
VGELEDELSIEGRGKGEAIIAHQGPALQRLPLSNGFNPNLPRNHAMVRDFRVPQKWWLKCVKGRELSVSYGPRRPLEQPNKNC